MSLRRLRDRSGSSADLKTRNLGQRVQEFFYFCGGSDPKLLEREECRTERTKHAAIGAATLSNLATAGLSGGYAAWTVFANPIAAASFGVFWGLSMFNLDRSLLANTRRGSDWKETAGVVVPRLALAGLLSVVVSKPIELKIFEAEINQLLLQQQTAATADLRKSIEGQMELPARTQEHGRAAEQLEAARGQFKVASDQAVAACGSAKTAIELSNCEQLRLTAERLTGQIWRLEETEAAARAGLEAARTAVQQQLGESAVTTGRSGLLNRIKALDQLSKNDSTIYWACWAILGVLGLLDVIPILSKVFGPYGPYDAIVEAAEESAILLQQRELLEAEYLTQTAQETIEAGRADSERSDKLKAAADKLLSKLID